MTTESASRDPVVEGMGNQDLPGSIVDAQVQRLLEVVSEYQKQACSTLLNSAETQSRQIVSQAYTLARNRLRLDVQESRQQMESALFSAKAKQHTFLMQQKHQVDRGFLDKAWELLESQLIKRWSDPQNRAAWIQNIVQVAGSVLTTDQWLIDCPQSLKNNEKQQIHRMISNEFTVTFQFNSDPALLAGIRIKTKDTVVDGSIPGLLADRVGVESAFLAFCRECIAHNHD